MNSSSSSSSGRNRACPVARAGARTGRSGFGIGSSACNAAAVVRAFRICSASAKPVVGDEGKGMRRVDGQRRQHREHLAQEHSSRCDVVRRFSAAR
jgi:hypothetical protein